MLLADIGATLLWRIRRTSWFARVTLAATLLVTGAWAWVLLGRSADWFGWLRVVIVLAAVGAAGLILAGPVFRAGTSRGRAVLVAVPVSLAFIVGLAGPWLTASTPLPPRTAGRARRPTPPRRPPSAGPPTAAHSPASRAGRQVVPRGARRAGQAAASAAAPAPPLLGCSRRARPATRGPPPPSAPTARPRWS